MGIEADALVGESSPPVALLTSGLFIGVDDEPSPDSAGWPGRDLGDGLGLAGWLRVTVRARSQDVARELAAVHAIARFYGRGGAEFAADEVAAALGWSRTMASQRLQLAGEVIDRLPVLHRALGSGAPDEVKVRAIAEATRPMPDDLAQEVTARVVGAAAGVSVSTLIDLIGSSAVALDPDWAQRREQAARRRVRVVATRNPSGTADVAVRDLHAGDAAAVMARVDALAAPVRAAGLVRGWRAPIHAVGPVRWPV